MNTLKDIVISIVGTYTPDITSGVTGAAQIDWVWIASFLIVFHCFILTFKMIKSIIKSLFGGWNV